MESNPEKYCGRWWTSENMKSAQVKNLSLFFAALFCLLTIPSLSGGKPGEDIIALVQKRYQSINEVVATFVQKNFIVSLNQSREFRGKIFLKKPHLFDMEVSFPSKQRQIFDGELLWIYTTANNQVIKSSVAPDFLDHPLINLLTTMEDLKKDFIFSVNNTKDSPDHSIRLTLKEKNSELREILITVKRKNFQIKEITLYYDSGNYTNLILSRIKENPGIPPERFQFTPPPGVEVVETPAPRNQP